MISMHSWVFKLMLVAFTLALPVAMLSGLGMVPVFLFMAVPCLPVCLMQRNFSPHAAGFVLVFALFLGWCFITLFWTPSFEEALSVWLRIFLMLFLGLMLLKGVSKMNEDQKHAIQYAFSFGMLIACLFSVFEVMTEGWVVTAFRNRVTDHVLPYNPDFMNRGLTVVALMYWPFAVAFFRFLRHKYHFDATKAFWLSVLMWVGVLSLLAQLQCLSATVAYLISTAVFVFSAVLRGKLTPLVAIGILLVIISTPLIMRQLDPDLVMKDFPKIPPSIEHRLYIWDFVIDRADEKPYVGWGFNSSPHIPGGDTLIGFGVQDDRKLLPSHPHNQVLQIWLETGAVGLAFFVWLVGYACYALLRTPLLPAEKAASLAALVSYLSVGFFSYGIWQYWWIASGLMCWILMRSISSLDPHAHSRAIATN
jgi:O-antigen ligase